MMDVLAKCTVYLTVVFLYFNQVIFCQSSSSSSVCSGAVTCQACYAIPGCAFCSSTDTTIELEDRCFNPNDATARQNCPADSIQDETSYVSLDTLPLTEDNQISIERATVRLRTGDSQSFKLNVKPAENFPLDLYMIVDLSFSLFDDLLTIKSISNDIADAIRNISTRFQVGFGTYVDKLAYPYISLFTLDEPFTPGNVPSACVGDPCSAPFSYVHNVNLTNVSSDFVNGLNGLRISTNADTPEGTLDAMAQAILCTDVVGWRENARKIMVVITDATVHVAGDGLYAGILDQAPSECRTKYDPVKGIYTYIDNTKFDYPSLEQIRTISESNLVSPVFAVLENVRDYFESIADVLSGVGAQVVTIQDNSANIIEALETAYENIVSKVRLSFSLAEDEDFVITYSVECPENTTANPDGLSCSSVTTNNTVVFTVNVTLLNCTGDLANGPRSVNVIIPGYGQFEIVVEGICRCECERTGSEPKSPACSGNGTFACGVCDCDPGWIGRECNCDDEISLLCPTDISGEECSGRGECLCGMCQCEQVQGVDIDTQYDSSYTLYNFTINSRASILIDEPPVVYGSACECDNFNCPRNNSNFVCSGNQGNCTCSGNCVCGSVEYRDLPYTGIDCSCNEAFCYNQSNPDAMSCNNKGDCNPCDRENPCNCIPGYVPPLCTPRARSLITCFGPNTFERSCIQCIADNDDYVTACTECFIPSVTSAYNRTNNVSDDATRCSYSTSDPICNYVYYISVETIDPNTGESRQTISIEEADCFPLRWWHIALILLIGLLLLGIVILAIVKIIFMVLDYKEVKHLAKSVAETDLSKNSNPLYQCPEVEYKNIMFGKE